MSPAEPQSGDDAPLWIGEWLVDPRADELRQDGRTIKLEPLRMRLLMALARRPGQVVLSNELLDTVWKGAIVTPSSLYQSVAQLRQHLGDDPATPTYIETVPRKGYRLIGRVRPALDVAPSAAQSTVAQSDFRSPSPASAPPSAAHPVEPAPSIIAAGNHPLRNRRLLLAGLAAGPAVVGGALWYRNRPPPVPDRIAVLPFTDRSAANIDGALAYGLTADVIRELGRHSLIEVLTLDAVQRLGTPPDLAAAAYRLLSAAYVLTGALTRTGEQVRLATRLIALPREQERDHQSFESPMDGMASVPPAVAQSVFKALDLAPLPRSNKPAPTAAYEMYVLGIDAIRAKTPESTERARQYFQRGIEIDPLFARNYSALGSSWIVLYEFGGGRVDRKEAFARSEALHSRALKLDPNLVEARLGLANVAREYRRYDEARRTYDAVIAEQPSNAQAHFGLALTEEDDGWPARAAAHYERAASLDPTHFLIPLRAGLVLMYAGRMPEARVRFERSIALDGSRANGYYSMGILHWMQGRLDQSVAAYREAFKRSEQLVYVWADYAFVCVDLGLFDEARRAFGRANALLKSPNTLEIEAAYVWLAEGAVPPAPAVLNQTLAPQAPLIRLLILAMAGNRPSVSEVATLDQEPTGESARQASFYEVVKGFYPTLEIATLYAVAGAADRAAPLIDEAERTVEQYAQHGVSVPGLDFHRARIAGLRGDPARTLAALQRAVDAGWRRAWRLRLDPAFATLKHDTRFTALVARIETDLAGQQSRVGRK